MVRITEFISNHLEKIVVILVVVFSITSFAFYFTAGLTTQYGDSRTHLDMARRVVDSLTPGLAQVGGYWLPLLHILMLPTVWNDFMWHSGISGAIPNMLAFVIAVVLMYRLVLYISKDKFSAFIGASVLLFNPNLLYMQSTPMTESLFIMTIVAFMYFFYRWFQEKSISDLIFAALFLILASLNRYEGWGLVIAANVLMIWYWVQTKFDRKIEGAMFAFASLSFLGIFLWLLWGAVIFNDPLLFVHHELSAASATQNIETWATWTGFGNLKDAVLTNVFAIFSTSGYVVLLVLVGVIISLLANYKRILRGEYLILFLLFVPLMFDIITVYTGKVPLEDPHVSQVAPPYNCYNVRYALYSLPALGLFIALITKRKIVQLIIFMMVLGGNFLLLGNAKNDLITLKDIGTTQDSDADKINLKWLAENHLDGLILVSAGAHDGRLFNMGIDQKYFITEGTYKIWDESLRNPAKYATFVLISENAPRDMLFKKIDQTVLQRDFHIEKQSDGFVIMKRNF